MAPAQRMRRAVVLSSFDLPDAQELLLHGCEDCACPVADDRGLRALSMPATAGLGGTSRWVCGREVIEIPLDPEVITTRGTLSAITKAAQARG